MTVNHKKLQPVYHWLKNKLHRCAICFEPTQSATPVCYACRARLTPLTAPLCRCSLPCHPADAGELCGRCIKQPPSFAHSHCAWQYDFPLDRVINRYKHHGDVRLEPLLVELWLQQLPATDPLPDALVPVPLHWWRHFRRGFNQSARLAHCLSQHTGIPLLHALSQPRSSSLLQGQSASDRRRQARGRFRVTLDVTHLRLVIIDDVMTTTSTANEAAHQLLKAGARQVDVWTLCRVLPSAGHATSER